MSSRRLVFLSALLLLACPSLATFTTTRCPFPVADQAVTLIEVSVVDSTLSAFLDFHLNTIVAQVANTLPHQMAINGQTLDTVVVLSFQQNSVLRTHRSQHRLMRASTRPFCHHTRRPIRSLEPNVFSSLPGAHIVRAAHCTIWPGQLVP